MANIRTIDYQGQKAAIGGYGPTGWILWSGSVGDCTSSAGEDTTYAGIGFEFIGSETSYIRFSHIIGQAAEIDIRAQSFMVGVTGSGGQFISGSGGNIEISSSNFHLTPAGNVTMQGTITATAGSIGGFVLSANALTGTDFTLDTTQKRLTLGSSNDIFIADADEGIFLGNAAFASAPFSVTTAGALKAVSGEIASFTISSDTLGTTGYSGTTSGVALTAGATPSIIARKDENNYIQQYYDSVTDWGLKGYSNSSALFELGSTNQIAGWKFDSSKIISNLGANSPSSPGIVINSNGTIETDPFISGLTANATGWQIRADGRAEFENAVIRGTLSTAVFEKDTISVVGGQVMVANAAKIDATNPRFIDYPFLHNMNGDPINYSGEELPAANQIGKYTGPFNPGGVYRTTDWVSNEPYQSDLWWKFTNAAAGTHTFTFTIGTVPSTSDATKSFRLTFYADKGTFGSGLGFTMVRLGYLPGHSGNYAHTGTSGSWNGAAYAINTSHNCIDGLNTYYFDGDAKATLGHKITFVTPTTGADLSAYVRDFHITEVSSSLTVDNAGGFAPGEIVVAKSTDQGPDGTEGFVREYMRIQSSSLGASETPASGTLDLSSTAISSGTIFHVTASKNYTFTGVASATADVPANNDYKYIVGANKSDSIRNIKNKIMEECLDTFAMVTGSTEGANDQIHLLSHGVGTDGNSYGIRQGATTVTLTGAVARVKPTLVVERNLDALVSGNGMGYSIQRIKDGQSVASQGKAGTGYILMNAQPTDDNSPYIDIVERSTDSLGTEQHTPTSQHSVFGDVKTVVRIGDLQGITDNTFSDGVSGYGIYTENGYFKGKIEVTNPQGASMEHNFGGPSGSIVPATVLVEDNELVGPQWYNTVNTRHKVENGVLKVSGSAADWTSELRSKQTFNREDDHTFQTDIKVYTTTSNRMMFGFGDTGTPSGTNSGNYSNSAHVIELNGSNFHVWEGPHGMNSSGAINNVSIAADDKFRLVIKPHINTKGASYKIYKYPELVTTFATFDSLSEANAKQDLVIDAGIWSNITSHDNKVHIENLKVLAPGQLTTTIEGGKITTGKIESTNLSTTSGSVFDLDDGSFKLGGTTDPKLSWNGTSLDIKGRITIEAGSIGPGGGVIETFATLAISSNTNIFSFDDATDNYPSPANATITVTQANQTQNLQLSDMTATNGSITSFSFTQGTNAGTGIATMTVTPTAYPNDAYPVTIAVSNDGLSDTILLSRLNGGSGGTPGADGRTVNLTAADLAFQYNTSGTTPSPATSVVTATGVNTTGTVFYEFIVNGTSTQNTTTNTITYTPPANFGTPQNILVKMREVTNSSAVLATDQISMVGLKAGEDAYTISLSNQVHVLPTTTGNVVTYTNSGTNIDVWVGSDQLVYGTGLLQYQVSVHSETDISANASPTTNANTYTRQYGNAGSFTTSGNGTANIVFAIAIKNIDSSTTTLFRTQTFSWSKQGITGDQGLQGDEADDTINTAAVYAYKRFVQGATIDQPITDRDWNFANAAFTNTDLGNSWTPTIPSGADNLFMCTAIASGTGTTDQIDASADWTTAQLLGAAGVPGEPAFTKTFAYDDFDTNGGAAGNGSYTFQQTFTSGGYGSNTFVRLDMSTANAVQFRKFDLNGIDNSTYFSNLVVGDGFTFYVSADRWYHYTINAVDASPPSNRFNFGLTFVSENITLSGGEIDLPTPPGTPVTGFRFQKAVDGSNGTNGVSTAVVYAYKRSASAPGDKPSTNRTWTFATGVFGNNDLGNSWTAAIPAADGNDLYTCTAVASAIGATDSVTAPGDWTTAQLLASNGSAGVNAKTITTTASSMIFVKDVNGDLSPSSITINASGQNLEHNNTSAWSTSAGTLTGTSTSTSGGTATITSANFVDGMIVTYTTHGNDDTLTDTITLKELEVGTSGIAAIVENEAHVLQASTTGFVSSYTDSGTKISVYEGATKLDYDGSGTTDGHWTIATSQSPSSTITIGSITDSTNDAVVGNHSSMVDGTDAVVITYSITGKTLNGTNFSFSKTQSISKSLAGVSGANAKTIVVTATSQIFVKEQNNDLSPTSIVITANGQNLTASGVWSTSAGTLTSDSVSSSGGTATITNSNFVDGMVITYTTAGGDGSLTDSVTMRELEQGSGNVAALSSNEAHLVPASSVGVVSSHLNSGTTIEVYEGSTQLDYDGSGTTNGHWTIATPTVSPSGKITVGSITDSSDSAVIADHTSMDDSTDAVSITYAISGKTLNGTNFSFNKTQTISKSKAGIQGDQGNQGNPGANNQDFDYLAGALNTVVTPLGAGLLMSDTVFGYHNAITVGDGTNAVIGDFTSYLDSSGNFYLSGDGSGGSLAWDNSANTLAIQGAITVTNTGDFANPLATVDDPYAALSGSQLYENFQTTLDVAKWTTPADGDYIQTLKTTTDDGTAYLGSAFTAEPTGDSWAHGLISNTTFLRSQATTLEFEFYVNNRYPRIMVGFCADDTSLSDLTTTSNYNHLEEALYVNDNAIHVYNNGSQFGGTHIINNAWVTGTDTLFRVRITLIPSGGARYEVYKDGDFTSPFVTATSAATLDVEKLKVSIMFYYDNTDRYLILGQLGVNSSVQPTRISGNSISTGKITSANWIDDGTVGSEINLDLGQFKLGGDTSPKLHFDGTDLAIDGKLSVGSIPRHPPVSKLLAHYTFDNGVIIDASGNNTDSVVINSGTPLFAPGVNGAAIYNDASHNINLPQNSTAMRTALASGQFTMCLWLTPKDGGSSHQDLITWDTNTTGPGGTVDTTVRLEHTAVTSGPAPYNFITQFSKTTGTAYPGNGTPALTLDVPVHLAFAWDFDNDTKSVYINSVLHSTSTFAYGGEQQTQMQLRSSGNIDLSLYESNTPGDHINDLRFYQGPLTVSEIEAIYTNPNGGRSTLISGNSISTGQIQSNNFSTTVGSKLDLTAGTIQMGGSTDPGFNVDAAGLVTATNLSTKSVTVDNTNYLLYTKAVSGGVKLVFDGLSADTSGGVAVMHMVLSYDPGLIKGFIVPAGMPAGLETEVTIDVNTTGIEYDEASIVRRSDAAK